MLDLFHVVERDPRLVKQDSGDLNTTGMFHVNHFPAGGELSFKHNPTFSFVSETKHTLNDMKNLHRGRDILCILICFDVYYTSVTNSMSAHGTRRNSQIIILVEPIVD